MKNIGGYYYDATGICPACGEGLVPVVVYSARRLGSQVSRKRQDINTVVKTTTVQYSDIQPQYVGCCLACMEKAQAEKEEAKVSKKPSPVSLILAVLVFVAAMIGILSGIGADGTVDAKTAGGVLTIIAVFVSFPALIWTIWALVAYLKKRKLYNKYASGWREAFQAPSEKDMSSSAAFYMNKQSTGDREYLSIGQVERMQSPLYGRY